MNNVETDTILDNENFQSEFDVVLFVTTIPQIITSFAMIFLYNNDPTPANLAAVQRLSSKISGKPFQMLTETLKYYWTLIRTFNYSLLIISWGSLHGMNAAFLITFPGLISQSSRNVFIHE